MTSSWFFLSTLNYDARSTTHQIKMGLQEVVCGYVDWIGLAQDRDRWRTLVSTVMNLRVPWNTGNFLTSCKPVSCSGTTLHHGVSDSSSILPSTFLFPNFFLDSCFPANIVYVSRCKVCMTHSNTELIWFGLQIVFETRHVCGMRNALQGKVIDDCA